MDHYLELWRNKAEVYDLERNPDFPIRQNSVYDILSFVTTQLTPLLLEVGVWTIQDMALKRLQYPAKA
jgi:hypothetical protein